MASMHEIFAHGYDDILTSTQPNLPTARAMAMASYYAMNSRIIFIHLVRPRTNYGISC
jgi:hypothetical protein